MNDEESLKVYLEKYVEEMEIKRKIMIEKYPPNPPNNVCYHALISGIKLENSYGPKVHDYVEFFRTQYEKIYAWTHTKDKYTSLVSEIDQDVKLLPFWKTIGHIIHLAQCFYHAFEITDNIELKYNWIYYFNPNTSFDDLELMEDSEWIRMGLHDACIVKATKIEAMAPLIELLIRDDICYTALSQMLSSFELHYCCLTCELGLSPVRMHPSHEPNMWEHAYFITKMEAGIIQACRCVESILGEPPNRKNKNSLLKHKARWIEFLQINPDDMFEKSGSTYLEFYYKLFFELRNPSAHSFGNIRFDLERKKTIEAQCFAAVVLRGYIETQMKSHEEAVSILRFNNDLLSRVSDDMSTSRTIF